MMNPITFCTSSVMYLKWNAMLVNETYHCIQACKTQSVQLVCNLDLSISASYEAWEIVGAVVQCADTLTLTSLFHDPATPQRLSPFVYRNGQLQPPHLYICSSVVSILARPIASQHYVTHLITDLARKSVGQNARRVLQSTTSRCPAPWLQPTRLTDASVTNCEYSAHLTYVTNWSAHIVGVDYCHEVLALYPTSRYPPNPSRVCQSTSFIALSFGLHLNSVLKTISSPVLSRTPYISLTLNLPSILMRVISKL